MDKFKRPTFPNSIPDIEITPQAPSNISRWIPLMCAGAAAGISIVALQEMKNVRKELIAIKRENGLNEELSKRMENMEQQLKLLADFVQNKHNVTKESKIVRNAVNSEGTAQENVRIINDEEYEEVEVTDDETEETEILN